MSPDLLLVTPSIFEQVAQAKSTILVCRFTMPMKNGSRNRLNHPNQRRSNFKPPGFHQYFAFYSLIRKDINLGPPDLDSPQKCASGDICHFHFGSHPICTKNTPSIYGSYPVVITWI